MAEAPKEADVYGGAYQDAEMFYQQYGFFLSQKMGWPVNWYAALVPVLPYPSDDKPLVLYSPGQFMPFFF